MSYAQARAVFLLTPSMYALAVHSEHAMTESERNALSLTRFFIRNRLDLLSGGAP